MASNQNGDSITGPYDTVTKTALDAIITAVLTYIFTAVPFLSVPFFKQITSLIVTKILEIAAKEPILWGAFLLIDSNVRYKLREYDEALTLMKEEMNKPIEEINNEALALAHQEWKKKLAALIRVPKP